METYTIERVGQEKEVNTKFGPKLKTGVIFKEYPDVWHDVWASGLKVGQKIEGERTSRVYQDKTYWSLTLPKKGEVQVQAVKKEINEKMEEVLTKLGWIKNYLETNIPRRTSDGKPVPFQSVDIKYPEDEINPEDVPF